MSRQCGGCSKIVYPAEELKCLDKVWHKQCFKCSECGMTLTLKNYVGFNKMPYCSAHNPSKKLQHTSVTVTPESKRVAELSKLNSAAEYRKEFEKSKGTAISVTDDPSTRLAQQQSRQVSGFSYNQVNAEHRMRQRAGSQDEGAENNNYYDEYQEQDVQSPPPVRLPFATSPAPPAFAPQPPPPVHSSKVSYKALYDYEAQDAEEVSFSEGDIIDNFEPAGEGWGTGVIRSTGERGMMPSNYLEQC